MSRILLAIATAAIVPVTAVAWPPRLDAHGDPLPAGAAARLGTIRWRHDAVLRATIYSPDGKALYSNAEDGTVRAWDARTGVELQRLAALAHCWKVQLSADGQLLAGLRH